MPDGLSPSVQAYVEETLSLLATSGVPGSWTVRVAPRMGRRLGTCNWGKREIRLSATLVATGDLGRIRDTIRHEVAHALARHRFGPGIKPHGAEWKSIARELGAVPRASVPPPDGSLAPSVTSRRSARAGTSSRVSSGVRSSRTARRAAPTRPFFVASLDRDISKGDVFIYQGISYTVDEPKRTRFTARRSNGQLFSIPSSLLSAGVVLAASDRDTILT